MLSEDQGVPRRKIALVGFTISHQDAPWGDPEWDVWPCNNLHNQIPAELTAKATGWFNLHDLSKLEDVKAGPPEYDPGHAKFLRETHCPVWVFDPQSDWPTALKFPRQEILDWWAERGVAGRRYFTNSISWMIAFSIIRLATSGDGTGEIGLYGIDMAQGCLAPETRVLTDDLRWTAIADIKIGDKVMAFDEFPVSGGRRRWRVANVEESVELVRPAYRLHMADGTKIVASQEHPWLTHACNTRVWRNTDKLVTPAHRDDRPSRIVKPLSVWDTERSWDAGYLAAAFDGEGHLSQICGPEQQRRLTLGFGQRENEMAARVETALNRYGYKYAKSQTDCVNYTIRGGKSEILRFLGQIRPERLLGRFDPTEVGEFSSPNHIAVLESEYLGPTLVHGIKTSTGTYLAEGFATHNSEYAAQRPSCEYWLGLAEGMGIKVTIARRADLLKCAFLYGDDEYSTDFVTKIRARTAELNDKSNQVAQRVGQLLSELEQTRYMQHQLAGALESNRYIESVWLQPEGTRKGGADPYSTQAQEPEQVGA